MFVVMLYACVVVFILVACFVMSQTPESLAADQLAAVCAEFVKLFEGMACFILKFIYHICQ